MMNWYKTAQEQESESEKSWWEDPHDYDPAWDYEEDPEPDEMMKEAYMRAEADIKKNYMGKFIGAFRDFTLYWTTSANGGMAQYCFGTYAKPVIVVDLSHCKDLWDEYKDVISTYEVAFSTLAHELWHAVQDSRGDFETRDKQDLEDEAEEFARVL